MKLSTTVIIASIAIFTACAVAVFLLQENGEDPLSLCGEVGDDYAMMFAFQYGGGAYFIKVDDDLFIWACRGPIEDEIVAEEDFANLQLNWRSAQIAREDFDYLIDLTKEISQGNEDIFSDDVIVLGAWTLSVFYDSYTFRNVSYEGNFGLLADKLVELSPIRVDLTVWGGS